MRLCVQVAIGARRQVRIARRRHREACDPRRGDRRRRRRRQASHRVRRRRRRERPQHQDEDEAGGLGDGGAADRPGHGPLPHRGRRHPLGVWRVWIERPACRLPRRKHLRSGLRKGMDGGGRDLRRIERTPASSDSMYAFGLGNPRTCSFF